MCHQRVVESLLWACYIAPTTNWFDAMGEESEVNIGEAGHALH